MMARKKRWLSVEIRLVVIATFCLSWNDHSVDAGTEEHSSMSLANKGSAPTEINERNLATLAETILNGIFHVRHQSQIRTMKERRGSDLNEEEESFKQLLKAGGKGELSNGKVRELLIEEMTTIQKGFQTIAVGVDPSSNTVVVAGNIKELDFDDLGIKTKLVKGRKYFTMYPAVKKVGFQKSDNAIITPLMQQKFSGYDIKVIRPSTEDLERAVRLEVERKNKTIENNKTSDQVKMNAVAHFFHAEMQIRKYFEDSLEQAKIMASKPYCIKCLDALPETLMGYGHVDMRWQMPKEVESFDLKDVLNETTPENQSLQPKAKSIDILTKAGGSCSSSTSDGRRRQTRLCSRFEDVTEVDADEFQLKLVDLADSDRGKLLSALDQVGLDKLIGSESAQKDINTNWKKWKSSVVKEIVGALSKGAIMAQLAGTQSLELSKTAISLKLLTESLDRMHKEKLNSAAEEYKRGKTIDDKSEGFRSVYTDVKAVNLGMLGKNLIGGLLRADTESFVQVGELLGLDQILTKGGNKMADNRIEFAEAGQRAMGAVLKATSPLVGTATSTFGIYSLVGQVNQIDSLKEMCDKKGNLFQERFEKDCKFDMDVAIANTVTGVVGIVNSVAKIIDSTLNLFHIATGPFQIVPAAVADVFVSISTQIHAGVQELVNIFFPLFGSSTGNESATGKRILGGTMAAQPIQNLAETIESYNSMVTHAVSVLQIAENFQTYVLPTDRTVKINDYTQFEDVDENNCFTTEHEVLDLLVFSVYETREVCLPPMRIEHYFENDSLADFQNQRDHRLFLNKSDTPYWGYLECNPNAPQDSNYPHDPQSNGYKDNNVLCHNVIALTAFGREHLPALIDLKNGTDVFMGFPNRRHVFIIEDGWKNFTGGSADDIFILKSFPFRGTLDGVGGFNTLVLDVDVVQKTSIDFSTTKCTPYSNCGDSFNNFHRIIGRINQPDSLVIACFLEYVDLKGGKSALYQDEIQIPASNCSAAPVLQLRSFTRLDNYHEANGVFIYLVEFAASIQVNLKPENNVHIFRFTNDIVTAHLSYRSGYLIMKNSVETMEFKCNYMKSTTSNFLLMTQQGLSINFDEVSDSFYGIVSLSSLSSSSDVLQVDGLTNYPNQFEISTNSNLNLSGGYKNDIFALSGRIQLKGTIDGGDGLDSLIIRQDFQPEATISVDFLSQVMSQGELKISKIEIIIGRPALPDVVKGSCELIDLDLRGGTENYNDIIQFSSQLFCKSKIALKVRKFTIVENLASSGDFSYQIELFENSATLHTSVIEVNMEKNGSATHKYIFLMDPSSASKITFDQVSEQFEIHVKSDSWVGIIPLERSIIYMGDQMVVQVLPEVRGIARVQPSTSAIVLTGLQNYPNTFVVGPAIPDSSFTGGRKDDTYFITSENFYGKLDGGEGVNTLFLNDSLWKEQAVILNILNSSLVVKSRNETVAHQLEFSNIQQIFGREGQSEVILSGCYTKLIDTKGGRNTSPALYDLVHISSLPDCFFILDVTIRPNLVVVNDATEGEFKYEGDFRNGGGSTSIFLTFTPYTYHHVYLDMNSDEYTNLQLLNGHLNITASDGSQFSVDFFIPEGADTHTQPTISFRDGLELKIFGNGLITSTLFGTLGNGSRSDILEEDIQNGNGIIQRTKRAGEDTDGSELIERYRRAAKDTLTSVMMQISSDTLVSIGAGGKFDILTAVPGYLKNILVCNSANETIYRIASGCSNVQIIFDLKSFGPKLLDLTPIVKDDFEIFPTIQVLLGRDLMFQIKDVEITIQGLADRNYEFLTSWQVLLRERFLNIEEEESGDWRLAAQPIVIDPKTVDSFVVNLASLESDMQILTVFNNDSRPIQYEAVKQGDSLVFTNLFQQDSPDVASSVVLFDFYNEKVPEAILKKRVMFEMEAGVMVNVTLEMGEDLPTFEQLEYRAFGRTNPLFYILPIFATFLCGLAWLCWSKKWYKSLKVCKGDYQLIPTALRAKKEKPLLPGTRLKIHKKPTDYELIPISKREELLMEIDHRPSYNILLDLPAKFKVIEKPLPIFQGLLRLQNFSSYDRYCRSSIECLEGFIPLPHVLVRALFSPQADCIRVMENESDFVVALPNESVSNVASVIFTLCLPKRSAVIRNDQGEIIPSIRRIMQVLRPACAEFIEQERCPLEEVVGNGIRLFPRFARFLLRMMEGKEYEAVVNTEGRYRLLDEPESALSSLDELQMRIQRQPRVVKTFPAVDYMDEALEATYLQELNDAM